MCVFITTIGKDNYDELMDPKPKKDKQGTICIIHIHMHTHTVMIVYKNYSYPAYNYIRTYTVNW